ncbi:MAG: hypothetical protein R2741_02455 [Methanolobus sp.]
MKDKIITRGISFKPDVWNKIEEQRGQTLRSKYVNECLRKYFDAQEA